VLVDHHDAASPGRRPTLSTLHRSVSSHLPRRKKRRVPRNIKVVYRSTREVSRPNHPSRSLLQAADAQIAAVRIHPGFSPHGVVHHVVLPTSLTRAGIDDAIDANTSGAHRLPLPIPAPEPPAGAAAERSHKLLVTRQNKQLEPLVPTMHKLSPCPWASCRPAHTAGGSG